MFIISDRSKKRSFFTLIYGCDSIMKKLLFIFALILIFCLEALSFEIHNRERLTAPKGGRITITILETTDVHGNIYPYDYFSGEASERGLAKVSTLVKDHRKKNPHTLLLDAGDLIQGTPLTFLFNHKYSEYTNPMILTMNAMDYDGFAVGNHDIEQGKDVYDKCRRESSFPWLAANAVSSNGEPYFDPYVIKEIGGVRIGILGMCTPGVPLWLNSELYPGIEFRDMVETAKIWVPVLREQEKVDLLVGLFHSGINEDYDAEIAKREGIPLPNASKLVAEQVEGFDIILTGHAHQLIPSKKHPEYVFNGVTIIQAGKWAFNLGVVEVELIEREGFWQVSDIMVENKSIRGVPADSMIIELTKEYHQMTLDYINRKISELDVPLSGQFALCQDTPLLDLVNTVQLEAAQADVSFTSCFNTRLRIDPGPLTVRDIYSIYRYENYLNKIAMTGSQIDSYLEYAAGYYQRYPFDSGSLFNEDKRYYNVDIAQGLRYEIDLSRPNGDRVNIISFSDGRHFYPDSTYYVAINSYRAEGGGGYMSAVGINEEATVWKSTRDIRELMVEYLSSNPKDFIKCDNNWKIVPEEAEKILLQSMK